VKLNFESFQERAKAQRKVMAAEAEKQKEEKTERKRKRVEAEKARLEERKKEEVEKARMEQSREAADQKVDGLLADGLAAELRKKDKAHQKRLKTLLENMFFTPPGQGGGVGESDTAAVPDEAAQSNDASNSNEPVELS
jgi:acetyl-CoA carboxylase carboxyltransferase component